MIKRVCRISSIFSMSVGFLVILVMGLFAPAAKAQEIRIKVVDGQNGRIKTDECVNVWVGKNTVVAMAIHTDKDGVATLHLTDDDSKISIQQHDPACGDFGVTNPVVKYADTIGITSGVYLPCQASPPDSPRLNFATKEVLESGVATGNVCGMVKASPKPGRLSCTFPQANLDQRLGFQKQHALASARLGQGVGGVVASRVRGRRISD
jgi:hypothetical protein